jgi:hypothetical protein
MVVQLVQIVLVPEKRREVHEQNTDGEGRSRREAKKQEDMVAKSSRNTWMNSWIETRKAIQLV